MCFAHFNLIHMLCCFVLASVIMRKNRKIEDSFLKIKEISQVPMAKSELFISEALEKVCENMENFARGRDKKTGRLVVLSLFDSVKGLNPMISEVDIITDSDLNKSLKYYVRLHLQCYWFFKFYNCIKIIRFLFFSVKD